jgi:hypothetical protein
MTAYANLELKDMVVASLNPLEEKPSFWCLVIGDSFVTTQVSPGLIDIKKPARRRLVCA